MGDSSNALETEFSVAATKIAAYAMICCFFLPVLYIALSQAEMFLKRYGRRHRVCGFLYLFMLLIGTLDVPIHSFNYFLYDVLLSCGGIVVTLSAAYDFERAHKRVSNVASGVLDDDKLTSYAEMIEHSFYQILNLVQITYLHLFKYDAIASSSLELRLCLAVAVTTPWLFRSNFPVNSFSANYTKGQDAYALTSILYRIKKYQYVFYKHVLLHGLNLTVAIRGVHITETYYFRLYWMALNTSYVMEFFLQTLVKRKYLRQQTMLILNRILMGISSVVALQVFVHINFAIAAISVVLNFNNRGYDTLNTAVLAFGCYLYITYLQSQ